MGDLAGARAKEGYCPICRWGVGGLEAGTGTSVRGVVGSWSLSLHPWARYPGTSPHPASSALTLSERWPPQGGWCSQVSPNPWVPLEIAASRQNDKCLLSRPGWDQSPLWPKEWFIADPALPARACPDSLGRHTACETAVDKIQAKAKRGFFFNG